VIRTLSSRAQGPRSGLGRALGACLALAAAALPGCSKQVTPPNVGETVVADPAVTPLVRLQVADHVITVTWTVDDTTRVSEYRVFRSPQQTGGYVFLATARSRSYADNTAQDGVVYFYQVVSRLTDGRLSQASAAVSGSANLFSLLINGGQERTRSLSLSLQLNAPSNTRFMELSEAANFAGAAWESYTTARTFIIPVGDGLRTIWARFRDGDGNESEPVSDQITVDTQAFLDSMEVSPAGGVLAPGTVVHFRIRPRGSETGGAATVDVGQRLVGLPLSDQGVSGDTHAGDGIYELDYTLPRGADVLRVPVVGHFTDAAGNRAPDLTADSLFTLHTPPSRVTLLSVNPNTDVTSTTLDLTWTEDNEAGFASYQVYRADAPTGLPAASAYARLTTVSARATVTYSDATPREGQSYAYRVDVVDSLGYTAQGAPVLATARSLNAVTLDPPARGQGSDSLNVVLTWSQTLDPGFASYLVQRAEGADLVTQPADAAFAIVNTINVKGTLTYTDVAPRENTNFWYRVDELGGSGVHHPSKAQAYRTLNAPPPAVTLGAPFEAVDGRVSLSWTQSTAKDFASYRVYRAQGAGADTSVATLVLRTANLATLTAVDSVGLLGNTSYWYRAWVTDTKGLATGSTEQTYTTHSLPPPAVSITGATNTGPGVGLTWTQTDIKDFESYRIFRARDASVSNGSVQAGTVTDRLSTSFFETFGHIAGADSLRPNTDYYYRVYVYNKGGLFAGSSPQLVHTPAWSQAPARPPADRPRPQARGSRN